MERARPPPDALRPTRRALALSFLHAKKNLLPAFQQEEKNRTPVFPSVRGSACQDLSAFRGRLVGMPFLRG